MANEYMGRDHSLDLIFKAYQTRNTERIREYLSRYYGKGTTVDIYLYEWAVSNTFKHFDQRYQVGTNRIYQHWSMTAKLIDTVLDIDKLRHDPLPTYPVNGRAVMGERNFLRWEQANNQVELDNIEQQLSEVA